MAAAISIITQGYSLPRGLNAASLPGIYTTYDYVYDYLGTPVLVNRATSTAGLITINVIINDATYDQGLGVISRLILT